MMERPKMGFSVPIERWLRGGLRSWADDLLSEASLKRGGLLRTAPIQQAWQWFLNGDASSALGLWAILNFQAWHEHWLNG
jgi:asparagine synthase (glutamine-hydrolysing)